jgi:hypothetical protein
VEEMDSIKSTLLREHFPDALPAEIHSGYHRGHRAVWGSFGYPDIISIHHMHLHVIVQPFTILKLLKYPDWFPLMWISDDTVLECVRALPEVDASTAPDAVES